MIPKLEDCKPGLRPMGYNILVAIDEKPEKSDGGIILTEMSKEREDGAAEKGLLVDASPMAFKGGDWGHADALSIGATVLFRRYAGTEIKGEDGRKYRIMNDEELRGVYQ